MLSAALLLASCAKEEADNMVPEQSDDLAVQVTAVSPNTRTAYNDTEDKVSVSWVINDAIGISVKVAGGLTLTNSKYLASSSGTDIYFTPEDGKNSLVKWQDAEQTHDFYAYYPHSASYDNPAALPVSVKSEMFVIPGLISHLSTDFLYAATKGQKMPEDRRIRLAFNHAASILAIDIVPETGVIPADEIIIRCTDESEVLAAENATIDITAENPVIDCSAASSTSNQVRLLLSPSTNFSSNNASTLYVQILPGHANKTLQVLAVNDGEERIIAEKTVNETGIPAGTAVPLRITDGGITIEKPELIDLSELGTANCYVVNSSDQTYRFRADVAGNGVMPEGMDETKISMTLNPTSARLLKTMVASNNYLNGTVDGTDETMSKMILRESVKLTEADGLQYVEFKTAPEQDFAAGNAVICVTDDESNILWSWHIWVTPGWKPNKSDIALTTRNICNGAVIMDRNLGALSNGNGPGSKLQNAQAACGLMYQWGRKDPFFCVNVGVGTNPMGNYQTAEGKIVRIKQACSIESDQNAGEYTKRTAYLTDETAPDIEDAINAINAHPETFYTHFNNTGQYTTPIYAQNKNAKMRALWGNPSQKWEMSFTSKTAYDPCPVGYRVPDANVLAGFLLREGGQLTPGWMRESGRTRFNIDFSKTSFDGSSVNFLQSYGIYAYTNSILLKDQDESERTNTRTTFIPMFSSLNRDAECDGNAKTSLLTSIFGDNRPGYNIENSGYLITFGYYGHNIEACPIRCMSEKLAE